MTDPDAFRIGENIAVTPGKVVLPERPDAADPIRADDRDRCMKRPLLIMPPWINKFYILDLRPKNSFIRWAVEQGHTVFVVSWVNPDERLAREELRRLHEARASSPRSTRSSRRPARSEINVIGYCLGGTLLASTLAVPGGQAAADSASASATYLRHAGRFRRVRRASGLHRRGAAAALDEQDERAAAISKAATWRTTFNMLRANDLIWSFVVNNYLLGKEPFPFDLLYWNSEFDPHAGGDAQLLPAQHVPGEPAVRAGRHHAGRRADRPAQDQDADLYPRRPRKTTSRPGSRPIAARSSTERPATFVLARLRPYRRRGQSAGGGKYGYWINDELPADPEAWLAGADRA